MANGSIERGKEPALIGALSREERRWAKSAKAHRALGVCGACALAAARFGVGRWPRRLNVSEPGAWMGGWGGEYFRAEGRCR